VSLTGVHVLVAGAGLAGLAAARDLTAMGAQVTVIDARDRIGGRVLTVRDGFAEGQHAEAGGDLIDEGQRVICQLADELGLKLTRILRGGIGYARQNARGQVRLLSQRTSRGWDRLAEQLSNRIEPYRLAERRWDTPITLEIARRSVAQWLDEVHADRELRSTATAMRGFFLADPEELSLIMFVDLFAAGSTPAPRTLYRIEGGNDRLAAALAAPLGDRLHLETELAAVSHRGRGVRAGVKNRRRLRQIEADYLVLALPATLLRRVPITPALPPQQHEAIASLKYGRATKTLIQFSRRFWQSIGQPRAVGSALPFGALWDGNENQRGPAGILSLLAGGSASDATRALVAKDGIVGLVRSLEWLGSKRAGVMAWRQIVWEEDGWSRGGYAFFDPAFDPTLRQWLARPFGALFFAGEHTSIEWQGYMNGAIESGRRAAREIAAAELLKAARR
jgi:monoamine oxidase